MTTTARLTEIREPDGTLPSFAWPGGYPLFYLDAENSVLCPVCANASDEFVDVVAQFRPVDYAINWEDPSLTCDDCSTRIPSAYAEDQESDEPTEDDLRTSDERHVYQYGKMVLELDPDKDRDDQVVAFMEHEQFFPNFFVISDHGNAHRVDLTDAFARFEKRRARRSHLLSFIRRGWCLL